MTLTAPCDNQPKWVDPKLGLEEFGGFKLGEKVIFNDDFVYLIHIQNIKKETYCRCMLPNGASITASITQLNKI